MRASVPVHVGILDYGVEIPLYHSYGRSQLMVYIVAQLSFRTGFFLLWHALPRHVRASASARPCCACCTCAQSGGLCRPARRAGSRWRKKIRSEAAFSAKLRSNLMFFPKWRVKKKGYYGNCQRHQKKPHEHADSRSYGFGHIAIHRQDSDYSGPAVARGIGFIIEIATVVAVNLNHWRSGHSRLLVIPLSLSSSSLVNSIGSP